MEYNSFYGGRRGASFVIAKKYKIIDPNDSRVDAMIKTDLGLSKSKTITEEQRNEWLSENCMIYCFSQGGAYKTVNYDEYVLIDTINKNDLDNGKLYRRGYDYNNDVGGAIFIGQIVGPAGYAPHVEMTTIEKIGEMATLENLSKTDSNGHELYRFNEGEYSPTENLIPGQYYDSDGREQFNDSIQWASCSVRTENSELTTAYIGFIMPYPVTQFLGESVSPYYHRTDAANANDMINWSEIGLTTDFTNDKLVERHDDLSHPFFSRWNVKVPRGKKGDSLNNFRVTTVGECEQEHPGWLQAYAGREDDEVTIEKIKERKILVYDYYNYDRDASGDPVSLFLGDYNQIDNFEINDYGTVTISYSHDDQDTYKNLFKWIKEVTLDKETGKFIIEYNYDKTRDGEELAKEDTKLDIDLTWIKDMTFDEDGTVKWIYTTSSDDHQKDNFVKWIKNVSLNVENGNFDIDFNYPNEPAGKLDSEGNDISGQPTHYHETLTWVKDILIDENGNMTIKYTSRPDDERKNFLRSIKEVTLQNGKFTITYNTIDESTGELEKFEADLAWVEGVNIDDGGNIVFTYSTGDTFEYEYPLRTIKQVSLSDKGHFEVVYNEKDSSGNNITTSSDIVWVSDISIKKDGSIEFIYSDSHKKILEDYIKSVEDVELRSDGHFIATLNYPDSTNTSSQKICEDWIEWVSALSIEQSGKIVVSYCSGRTEELQSEVRWLTGAELSNDGTLTLNYNAGDPDVFPAMLRWITDVNLNENGTLVINYNNASKDEFSEAIKWISDIQMDNKGKITITYNNNTTQEFENKIKWIVNMGLNESGVLTVNYNDETQEVINLKMLSDVSINTGTTEGEGNQKIKVSYVDGTSKDIGNPINYIMETAISDNSHFLVLYSDPAKRQEIKNSGLNATHKGRDDWYDLGYLGQGSIGALVSTADDAAAATIAETLPAYSAWFIIEE